MGDEVKALPVTDAPVAALPDAVAVAPVNPAPIEKL
jgi:hypothetical protein